MLALNNCDLPLDGQMLRGITEKSASAKRRRRCVLERGWCVKIGVSHCVQRYDIDVLQCRYMLDGWCANHKRGARI